MRREDEGRTAFFFSLAASLDPKRSTKAASMALLKSTGEAHLQEMKKR